MYKFWAKMDFFPQIFQFSSNPPETKMWSFRRLTVNSEIIRKTIGFKPSNFPCMSWKRRILWSRKIFSAKLAPYYSVLTVYSKSYKTGYDNFPLLLTNSDSLNFLPVWLTGTTNINFINLLYAFHLHVNNTDHKKVS